jgi:hypothetical protein
MIGFIWFVVSYVLEKIFKRCFAKIIMDQLNLYFLSKTIFYFPLGPYVKIMHLTWQPSQISDQHKTYIL